MTTASTPAGRPTALPDTAPTAGGASRDRPGVPVRRIAFLDVARALAMIGVVVMNAPTIVFAAERLGEREQSTLVSIIDGALGLLVSGRARALLMVLLGVGAVLAWRSATRRGGRPLALMLRRYGILGLIFGVPHLMVFHGDILTHYALAALVLAPLMPFLLAGARARPFWFAVGVFVAAPFLEYGLEAVLPGGGDAVVTLVPQTLGFFCVGVWLARRPELDPAHENEPTRLPLRMVWLGLVVQVLGLAALYGSDLLFPVELGPDGVPLNLNAEGELVSHPVSQMLDSVSATLVGLGGALLFLGLAWWLVRRNRTAARALGTLVPLGRMTLTVYLASTAVFLLSMKPFEGEIPIMAQYGIATAYFVVMALFARWWLHAFRLGPLEWLWRSLTHLRPMPMRRASVAGTERSERLGTARPTDRTAGQPPGREF